MTIPKEDEWKCIFGAIFQEVEDAPVHKRAYGSFEALKPLIYNDKGEAGYTCKNCNRSWQSINGLVEFEYRLSRRPRGKDRFEFCGDVKLNLNGQKCKSNSCQKEFVKPEFHNEAIYHLLEKLLVKVKQKFYECNVEDLAERFKKLETDYKPEGRGNHMPEFCEACNKGLCKSRMIQEYDKDVRTPTMYGRSGNKNNIAVPKANIYVRWELKL